MTKPLTALLLAFCLAAIALGCGGASDSSSLSTAATGKKATTTAGQATGKDGGEAAKNGEGANGEGAAPDGGGGGEKGSGPTENGSGGKSTGQAAKIKPTGGKKTPPGAKPAVPASFKAPPGGDNSIQTYGQTAEGAEAEEVIAAMRKFFIAMATLDYVGMCEGLTEANRESMKLFTKAKGQQGGTCEEALEALLLPAVAPEARQAANGSVYEVRTEDGTAFVMFTPEGGTASYFVMKSENGGWHSTGLAPGTPFNPAG
jgi:hypothetical protein